MKRLILFLALAAVANAGVVRFTAKSTYKVAKFTVKAAAKTAKVAFKVAY